MNKIKRNLTGMNVESASIKLVVFTLLSFMTTINYAQTGAKNSIAYPSANNNSLPRNISDDVDLYQGKVNINIPLHTIQTTSLSVPVSLSYEGGNGIKVQEIASQVGLGWKIKAGGYITRIVRGLPDEDPKGYIGTGDSGHRVNEKLNDNILNKIGNGEIDGEPDLFILVTPSFELTFVFDPNGDPVFNKTKGIQITHNLRSNGGDVNNTSWTVKGLDGTIYKFGSGGYSRESLTIQLNKDTKNFVSTWYLDQIASPNLVDQINFEYLTGTTYSFTDQRISKTEFEGFGKCQQKPFEKTNKVQYTFESPKYVSKIYNRSTELRFNYLNDRRDLTNASRLESIYLYSSGNTNHRKGLRFSYSYFGPPTGSNDELRLKLDAIKLEGSFPNNNLLHFASFKYNTNENLPNRNSHEFDHMGYYNINVSGSPFPPEANKEPYTVRAQANILNEIKSITGDITTIVYEQNTVFDSNAGRNIDISGLRLSAMIKSSSGKSFRTEYHYDDAGKSSGRIVNENYKKFQSKHYLIYAVALDVIPCVIEGNITSSTSLFNSVETQGNLVGYSKVKTIFPNQSYIIKQFTNVDKFPDQYNPSNSEGTSKNTDNSTEVGSKTSFSSKRGLLFQENLYEPNGNPIKEVVYSYSSLNSPTSRAVGVKAVLWKALNGGAFLWTYGSYTQITDYYALSSKTEIDYDRIDATLSIVSYTDYAYTAENMDLLKKVDIFDSKQHTATTTYLHPQDLPGPNNDPTGIYHTMVNNNVLSPVIEIRTSKKTPTSTMPLSSKTHEFFMPSPLIFVPETTSEKKGLNPEFVSAIYTKYDSYGHATESKQPQGTTSSYLYDAFTQSLIGEANNATLNDIAYTSFESNDVGNWKIPELPRSEKKAITGTRSALLDDYIRLSKPNLNQSKQYILTYWVYGNNLPIVKTNTVIPANLVRTKGDWKQYQCIFSNATIVYVDSEMYQTVILDELRLQPLDASMVTYTYDPAAGITSMTDARGQISYYNYDDYLRLKEIRDFDQNIIESYQYHYHTPIN